MGAHLNPFHLKIIGYYPIQTTPNQQGPDIGSQYRSVIFYHTKAQQAEALAMIDSLTASKKFASAIVTEVLPAVEFYPAEDYHQLYIKKQTCR